MKHHSKIRRLPGRSCLGIVLLLGLVTFPQVLFGQFPKWSFAASAGYNQLRLDAVDQKNQFDVEGWSSQGYTLQPLASVKESPFYSFAVGYRYDREFAVSFVGAYWSKQVASAYTGSDSTLQLERGVGATDLKFAVSYYPSAQLSFLEWYFQTNLGVTLARATSKTTGSRLQKQAGALVMTQFVDTDAQYKKSNMVIGVLVGADIPLIAGFRINAEAGYRFAQLGTMDGDVTQMGQTSPATSTTDFDFSGFQVNAGLKFQF